MNGSMNFTRNGVSIYIISNDPNLGKTATDTPLFGRWIRIIVNGSLLLVQLRYNKRRGVRRVVNRNERSANFLEIIEFQFDEFDLIAAAIIFRLGFIRRTTRGFFLVLFSAMIIFRRRNKIRNEGSIFLAGMQENSYTYTSEQQK